MPDYTGYKYDDAFADAAGQKIAHEYSGLIAHTRPTGRYYSQTKPCPQLTGQVKSNDLCHDHKERKGQNTIRQTS